MPDLFGNWIQTLSYSQSDEEKYILQAVSHLGNKGRFLEIGAWQPKNLSNSRALFELGWSGVLVEPSPEPFLSLLREYGNEPRVKLVSAAVDHGPEILLKFRASADALSTSSETNYQIWKDVGGFYGTFYSPTVTIPDLIETFGVFDFVSIDAEGTSVDLLHALLATEMRPDCLCVEYDLRSEECLSAAGRAGYHAIYSNAENMVFAR